MAKISFKDVGTVSVEAVTAKAVLVRKEDDEWWFPLSTISSGTRNSIKKGATIEKFLAEEWFLEKEEIPFNEEN